MSQYQVGDPKASGAPAPRNEAAPDATKQPRAVFVAHGMGQQVRFATMDDFARGICEAAERSNHKITRRTARTVRVGCTIMQRIELDFENLSPVHVYEGYWAPLTEGVVTLRDTLRFLFGGALNGLRSRGVLHRWLFGSPRKFKIPLSSRIQLWLALVAVVSTVLIGATIVTVGIARLTLSDDGVPDELVRHLTGIFEALLVALLLCTTVAAGMAALIRAKTPKKRQLPWPPCVEHVEPSWAKILVLPAAAAGVSLFAAAVLVVLTILRDVETPFPGVCREVAAMQWCCDLLHDWIGPRLDTLYNFFCALESWMRWILAAATLLAAVGAAIYGIAGHHAAEERKANKSDKPDPRDRATGGRLSTTLILFALVPLLFFLLACSPESIALLTWLLLLGGTVFVRRFLIQYVGDVAAYVCPHVIDRFFDLRRRVKDTVWKAARAVYAMRNDDGQWLYDTILVAGHSLGSVVVYDALNKLISDDELFSKGDKPVSCDGETPEPLDTARRTKLLLTYGSPLDKTAFIFGTQDPTAGSERDALTASQQPLIVHEKHRPFEWRNIWSPLDIISGRLEFYDPPKENDKEVDEKSVRNEVDPDANILLAAHTQYSDGHLLFDRLYEKLSATP